MDFTVYNKLIAQEKERGRTDALDLRLRSPDLDGTGLIAEERKAPVFDPQKDYSDWPVGAPVREFVDGEYQVFSLLQPHNASHYPNSTPSNARALWSLCHTTDPMKAKPYVAPLGISGLWMFNECCTGNGRVYQSAVDNGAYAPSEYPQNWNDLGPVEEVQSEVYP